LSLLGTDKIISIEKIVSIYKVHVRHNCSCASGPEVQNHSFKFPPPSFNEMIFTVGIKSFD